MSLYYKNIEVDQIGFFLPDAEPDDQVTLQGMVVVKDMPFTQVMDTVDAISQMITKVYGYDMPYSLCVRAVASELWLELDNYYELSVDPIPDSSLGVYEYLKYRYGDHVSLKEWEEQQPDEEAYDTL